MAEDLRWRVVWQMKDFNVLKDILETVDWSIFSHLSLFWDIQKELQNTLLIEATHYKSFTHKRIVLQRDEFTHQHGCFTLCYSNVFIFLDEIGGDRRDAWGHSMWGVPYSFGIRGERVSVALMSPLTVPLVASSI